MDFSMFNFGFMTNYNIATSNTRHFNFNHRVSLQKEKQTTDDCGTITSSWEEIAKVWAKIEPISFTQNFSRMKNDVEITHKISIRYRNDTKDVKKIIFNDREFYVISSICPEENYELLIFDVKEQNS